MKTINSIALGTISSLLLSAGMKDAAQKLDPLSRKIAGHDHRSDSMDVCGTPCVAPCFFKQGID